MTDLLLAVARIPGVTLRAQVEQALRDAIRSGRLPPGSPLPSSRTLAADLGVSRGLVVEAYAQLVAEGYAVARQGSGTRVAGTALAGTAPAARPASAAGGMRIDFRPGLPELSMFPRRSWLAAVRRVMNHAPASAFGYGDVRGVPDLRATLCAYLGRVRGVLADPQTLVVTSGFAQGFGLVCRALARRGTTHLAVEDPCHAGQRAIVAAAGLRVVPVPVDAGGLRVDRLERTEATALLASPAHQFPTGAVLAPERRARLLAWAEQRGAVVVEDDYDAEFRYDRDPIGALQGLAPERVCYAGSVSKTLAPALRLGWLAPPSWLADDVAHEKLLDDLGSPGLDQLALAELIASGELDRHLRRARLRYRARRDVLVGALGRHVPGARVQGVAAGIHLVAELPPGTDEAAVVRAAAARSIGVYGIAEHRVEAAGPPALVLGYGRLSEAAIEAGVRTLGAVIRAVE